LTLPSVLGANDPASGTLTAYNSDYTVATGYTGTVHFSSSDTAVGVLLPVNYTFSGADAGTHTFTNGFTLQTAGGQTVTVNDIANATYTLTRNVIVGPRTPTGLVATATTTTHVDVSWNAATGAATYELMRLSAGSPYATVTTTAALSYPDNGVVAGQSYVYKVRAMMHRCASAAERLRCRDDEAVHGRSRGGPIDDREGLHITDLRSAVNMLRAAAGLGAGSHRCQSGRPVHPEASRPAAARRADPARAAAWSSADQLIPIRRSTLSTVVKAAHIVDLAQRVK
jgi:hypothetical protein